jgi:hypothetical protein
MYSKSGAPAATSCKSPTRIRVTIPEKCDVIRMRSSNTGSIVPTPSTVPRTG